MSIKPWTVEEWQKAERAYYQKRHTIRLQILIKRSLEIGLTGSLCLLLFPVLLLIALAVRFSSPGPIFFRQERLGRFGKTFWIYKFRSMVDGAIHQGAGLDTFKGDPRITPVGSFLRDYHLDELPQLLNVLRGEMSLVGPRPLLPAMLFTYTEPERHRLLMSPGITGWQQINGGEQNSAEQNIELDLWYIWHWNIWQDILILLRTFPVVLRKEGLYDTNGWKQGRGVTGGHL
jgi:lipopolysaccharide/colanic/teichoic acid biosynthesis glycosyltransferase